MDSNTLAGLVCNPDDEKPAVVNQIVYLLKGEGKPIPEDANPITPGPGVQIACHIKMVAAQRTFLKEDYTIYSTKGKSTFQTPAFKQNLTLMADVTREQHRGSLRPHDVAAYKDTSNSAYYYCFTEAGRHHFNRVITNVSKPALTFFACHLLGS